MSNQQHSPAIGTDRRQDFFPGQVNLFLFDLKNEALEHGFKPDDSWTLQIASEAEITSLRKLYYPVVSVRLQPDALLKAFRQVKSVLQQTLSKTDDELTESSLVNDDKKHLAAYPARKTRP